MASPELFSLFVGRVEDEVASYLRHLSLHQQVGVKLAGLTFWMLLFADDIVVFARSYMGLNAIMASLKAFFDANDLILSTAKTVCMHCNAPADPSPPPIHYGDVQLQWVDTFKYLGLQFTSEGSVFPMVR